MSEVNYEKLRAALDNLQEQYEYWEEVQSGSSVREVVLQAANNSVVHCCDICLDTLWKYMKRHLEQDLSKVPNSPKGVFRHACEDGMIDQSMLERLIEYWDNRRQESHDYSEEKALAVIDKVSSFIQDAEELYKVMSDAGQ